MNGIITPKLTERVEALEEGLNTLVIYNNFTSDSATISANNRGQFEFGTNPYSVPDGYVLLFFRIVSGSSAEIRNNLLFKDTLVKDTTSGLYHINAFNMVNTAATGTVTIRCYFIKQA